MDPNGCTFPPLLCPRLPTVEKFVQVSWYPYGISHGKMMMMLFKQTIFFQTNMVLHFNHQFWFKIQRYQIWYYSVFWYLLCKQNSNYFDKNKNLFFWSLFSLIIIEYTNEICWFCLFPDLEQVNDWSKASYTDVNTPVSPCISLQWTRRDGCLVNLPQPLLVQGDIIFLRPGQTVPGKCQQVDVSSSMFSFNVSIISFESEPIQRERYCIWLNNRH